MRIETRRLIIADLTNGMWEDVYRNSREADMRRFVPDEAFETADEAREAVTLLIGRYGSAEGPFVHPILLKTGENIGYVQLVKIPEGWEIGYHVAERHAGKGYASEALRAFLPVIAAEKDLTEVYGVCLAENTASARVLEKCGFAKAFHGMGTYHGAEREIVRYIWRA